MYLLAWPLVCSTTPSGFVHGPSLGPADNLSQRNATRISSLFSSSLAYQQQQQEQQEQRNRREDEKDKHKQEQEQEREDEGGHRRRWYEEQRRKEEDEESSYQGHQPVVESETVHPYNEYSWEVNQINPWLSACDLAGPAPADLQGSCGPPEVPKNCPTACTIGDSKETEFLEVIERNSWSRRVQTDEESKRNTNKDINKNKKIKRKKRKNVDGVRRSPEQCLFYLEESHKRDICRDDFGRSSTRSFLTPRENRYWFMSGLRLRHCCEHAVVNALAPGKAGPLENVLNGGQKCADALDKLLLVDALAARLHCEFEEVLARYDCAQPYSVIFNCTHCKEAYRKWVCSSLVPYFAHGGPQDLDSLDSWAGSRLRPCRSFCQSVEQRCPYLLPGDRAPAYPTQYAGEPTFLCRDPNIPETGEQAARALHSSEEDGCCFHACSEEDPASGICANCTNREPRKRARSLDPPTAPFCEINPIPPASTGVQYGTPGTTDNILEDGEEEPYDSSRDKSSLGSLTSMVQQQGASLCGTGGVGSMTSVSSSDRSTIGLLPQLFWLCSVLTGNPMLLRFSRIILLMIGNGQGNGFANSDEADLKTKWLSRVERRRGGRWCWCWCWWWCWWWRFRRISLSRWKLPRRIGTRNRISPLHGPGGGRGSFVAKCRWRRWNWWWWWLYRWWTFSCTIEETVEELSKKKKRRRRGGRRRRRRRRRRDKWRRKRRSKGCRLDVLCNDVWHCSATRRYFRLSSRKDPP